MATGNSKAAKSARVKLQLRDKNGRWIEMGGGVKWYSPNLGKYMFGTAVDATENGLAVVEVKNPNPNSKEKIFTVNIAPSQLEKVKAKASLDTNGAETIKLDDKQEPVEPAIEKNNKLFENMHKNPAGHKEPFGQDYESVPFDKDGVNNLQKNDLVVYSSEGTLKKGQVIGTDKKSGKPIIQPEVSSSWGFGGKGMPISLDKIWDVYKPIASSPSNKGAQQKADLPVPAVDKLDPAQIAQNLSGPTQTAEEKAKTEKEIADYKNVKGNYEKYKDGVPSGKKPELTPAQKLEQEAADNDTAVKKDAKLNALMAAKTGTRLLSADEKTINLVKQDGGYWTEEDTGKNYTSTQVVEEFAGEKSVSMISPAPEPLKPGELSSAMTPDEFKNNLSVGEQADIDNDTISSPYNTDIPAFKNYPGYTEAEEYAIMDYVGDSSMLNEALRLNNSNVTEYRNIIAGMDSLLKKSPITEPITVWRGIRATPELFDKMMNHDTYMDLGFSASSLTEQVARNWVKGVAPGSSNKAVTLKISLPAGFHAHKVDYSAGFGGIQDFDEEDEVVLPRNTMFKVISMEQNANNSGYTAVVEPILTNSNSTEGVKNDGSSTGNTGDTSSTEDTNTAGNESGEESGTLPINSGDDNISNGGTDSGGSGETEQGPTAGPESGNETGPVTETPAEAAQELGKLYSDAQGQYMLGTDGQKFRNGDKVSYTKKGVTEEGKIVALYEGVKSARVEFPDGTKSIKKISALTSLEMATQDTTEPVETESAPAVDVPETLPTPVTLDDFETPAESFDKSDFDMSFPIAVADIPVGTVIKLKSNPEFALKKIGDNNWSRAANPEQQISNNSIQLAMGLKNNGKPSYDVYMPKNTATPEAPIEAQDVPEADVAVVEPTTTVTGNLEVISNAVGKPGSFHVKSKDKSPVSVHIDSLKEGDVVYPVGTQTKPYGTHGNYSSDQVFIDMAHPAGMGTVAKNDPNKPYIQVMGTDGEMYFPSKNFVATKQSEEIDKLVAGLSEDKAFQAEKADAVEETAAPEELAAMETAAYTAPVDVSTWKKIKASSGSNPGGEYEAPDGTHFFIKQSKSDLHAKNEVLASDIYQAAGISSLELGYSNVDGKGKLGTIAPMISGAKTDLESKLATDVEYKKEFQKGWAVDAWLGNWDVVGLVYDNAVTDDQGKAVRVDPGGALLFRAMGSPKSDAMFGDSVGEWDSMRTDTNNYQTHDAFGDMTNDQIKESVAIVASFTDKMIDDLVDKHDFDGPTSEKLKTRLKNRRDDLITRAAELPGTEPESEKPLEQWEEDLLNGGSDEEITNESVQPSPSMPSNLDSEEALKVLKEKLLNAPEPDEAPVDENEVEPLADWEKELLEGITAEQKVAVENGAEAFDLNSAKPGTLYGLPNGQDAFVGKYNTEIAYGVTVDYFKKNEKKSGVVLNIMVNQQSAKVGWSDGSSSIIKASQLVGKGNPTTTNTNDVPDVVAPAETKLSETFVPGTYTNHNWSQNISATAADYPVGTVMSWKTDANKPNKYGWEKIADNQWTSVNTKTNPNTVVFPDSDMDDAKDGSYYMYIPENLIDPTVDNTTDVVQPVTESDNSVPSKSMNWLQQGGKPSSFPIGTKVVSSDTGLTYEKFGEDNWLTKNAYGETKYSDNEMVYVDFEEATVVLSDGFEFFEPDTKGAADYPVNTTLNKNTELRKIDEHTWITKSGINYTNGEIDALSMPSTWIVKINNTDTDFEDKVEAESAAKTDLFAQAESVVAIIEKVFTMYEESVGEEASTWDDFTNEFSDYIPGDEENFVTIGGKKLFIVPDGQKGSIFEVAIKDEFDHTYAHVPANSSYGNFDSYLFNSQLDIALAKIQKDHDDALNAPKNISWADATQKAADLPVGTYIKGVNTTLEKTSDSMWVSKNTGTTYENDVIDSLKISGSQWMLETVGDLSEAAKTDGPTVSTSVTKSWVEGLPSASEMPYGAKISTGTGAGAITFEKITDNTWSPTDGATYIKHPDSVMDQLKGSQWTVSAPASAFEPKVESVEPAVDAKDTFAEFEGAYTKFFSDLYDMSWSSAKSTELEFEVNGSKFTFAPHPMSSSFAPYMKLAAEDGTTVFSENDFEVENGEPSGFDAATVFEAAKAHAQTFAVSKKTEPVIIDEYKIEEGKTLADITYEDFIAVPAGTKIDHMVNGMVNGTYQKNSNNSWRFQSANKDKPSHQSESNADFKFFMENNKDAASNYVLKAPDAPEAPEEEILVQTEKPKFVLQHQVVESEQQLADYAANTIIKVEQNSWQNQTSATFFVKKEDGNWAKFVKTPNTVSEKNVVSQASLKSMLNSWYKTPVAISMPTDTNHAILGTGEHGYVGDTLTYNGKEYKLEKINKTALNLIDANGNKVKIPAKKLSKDKTFGIKDNSIQSNSSAASKYDLNTINPISTFVAAKQAEEALKQQLVNFAGASSTEYDEQGLGLPVSPEATKQKNLGLSVIPVSADNTKSPLFGVSKPEMPVSPQDYPSFEETVLDGLPKWDSAEWLKKVEERYIANPNKKFANVQKSTQWNKIEEVLKGNQGYTSYLQQLLGNKYIDQDLYDMAAKAIDEQEKINKPLKKAHQDNVTKEKAEYEAKKLAYMSDYNDQVEQYAKDIEEWSKVNINASAVKKLPNIPELVNNPFTGGPADWSKSHPGTHAVQTIMDAMRNDNNLARYGLGATVDSDKIEETAVTFNKVKDMNGVEKFEIRFKLTSAFGDHTANKLSAESGVNMTNSIYYAQRTNMMGKSEDELPKLMGKPSDSNFVNSGKRFEYVDTSTGANVIFQHAGQTGQNISINHNSVQILLDVNATPADFQLALENLGINAKPSTPGALRVVAENKLLSMFSGESNWGNENFTGDKRQKTLEKVRKEYNITADDVVVETDANGRIKFFLTDAKVEEFMKKSPIKEFKHSVYAGEDIDVWESILSGVTPGLTSSYFRGQNGIGVLKSSSGMSPDKDMAVGSGNGIFITPHSNKEKSAPYYNFVGIHAKSIMRRLDMWGNMSDNYGKNDKGAPTPFHMLKNNSHFHEVMPRDTVPVSDFAWVTLGSATAKKKLIERLTAKGIFMINGLPLEKFILTNSEVITPSPIVNTPGAGVAPSGPVV